jgi:hypothetical protein
MSATGTPTPNLGLRIPLGTDPAAVEDINYNAGVLDTKIGAIGNDTVKGLLDHAGDEINALGDGLAIIANGNTHAAIAAGEFVFVRNHGSLATGLYKATTAIAANGALSSSNLAADSKGGLNSLSDHITKITCTTKITCSSQSDFETKANTLAGTLSSGEITSVAFGFPSGMIFNGTSAWGYINRYSTTRWNMILTSYDDSTYVVNIQYNNGTFKYTDLNDQLTQGTSIAFTKNSALTNVSVERNESAVFGGIYIISMYLKSTESMTTGEKMIGNVGTSPKINIAGIVTRNSDSKMVGSVNVLANSNAYLNLIEQVSANDLLYLSAAGIK